MPFAAKCHLCNHYFMAPKPIGTIRHQILDHYEQHHKDAKFQKYPLYLVWEEDTKVIRIWLVHKEQGNEYVFTTRRYSEKNYTVIDITFDDYNNCLKHEGYNVMIRPQHELRSRLAEYFDEIRYFE